jgi:predicted DCC family thiol-disulfide oxidoreductase YuxK
MRAGHGLIISSPHVTRSIEGMEPPIVFYDKDCGFCRWSADRLRSWDRRRRLRFATIQGPEGARRLASLDEDTRLASWHLVARDGTLSSAGAAVPPVLRLLPGGHVPAAVFAAFPVTTQRLYVWLAQHREGLGALLGQRACSVDPARSREP